MNILNNENVKRLYQDAIYWHLISEGYSEKQAILEAKKRMLEEQI